MVLQVLPDDGRVLAPGRSIAGYHVDLANNLLDRAEGGDAYYVDHEIQRHEAYYGCGLDGGWDVRAGLAYTARNGGVLDSVISRWHGFFGMKGDFREKVPRRRSDFLVSQDGRLVINERESAGALTSLTLQAKRRIPVAGVPEDRLLLAGRALVKIPLGGKSRFLDNGAVDAGLGLAASYHAGGRVWLHGNFAYVRSGATRVEALEGGRQTLWQSVVVGEYVADDRTSFLVQSDGSAVPYRTGAGYADGRRQMITAGLWRVVSPTTRAFFSFSENEFGIAAAVAPDFTISTGVEGRW